MKWGGVIGACIGGILGMAFVSDPSILTVYPSLPGQGIALFLSVFGFVLPLPAKVYAVFVVGGNAIIYGWLGYGISRIRERNRREASHCENCDYNLTGNVSGICPECGTKIETP